MKWISVNDALPIEEAYVLIVVKTPFGKRIVDKGYISDEKWVQRGRGGGTVTHWMPLPELPKEE